MKGVTAEEFHVNPEHAWSARLPDVDENTEYISSYGPELADK